MTSPCPTCGGVRGSATSFSKYGWPEQDTSTPVPASGLEIVGAPLFDDTTSGSNFCVKRCSACGALFEWEHEYEFLAGGSEDTTTLTRLDERGARRVLARMFDRLRQRTRPATPPRTAPLPGEFGAIPERPVEAGGSPVTVFPLMEALRARAVVPRGELEEALEAHQRFVTRGGAGGGWALSRTSVDPAQSVVFAFYGCPEGVSDEGQARLTLMTLEPPGGPVNLASADLLAITCQNAVLDEATLDGALLIRADLSGTSLRGARLRHVDLTGARLVGCDLREADLRGADLEGAILERADLRGARLEGARFPGARTVGVRW